MAGGIHLPDLQSTVVRPAYTSPPWLMQCPAFARMHAREARRVLWQKENAQLRRTLNGMFSVNH